LFGVGLVFLILTRGAELILKFALLLVRTTLYLIWTVLSNVWKIFCPTRAPNLQAPVAADLATVSLRRSAIGIAEDETPRIARRGNIGVYRKMQRKTDRNGVGNDHTILLKIFEVTLIALTCIGLVIYADQLYEILEVRLQHFYVQSNFHPYKYTLASRHLSPSVPMNVGRQPRISPRA
ncbi:hypothetical protein SCHPADRAFT_897020, partial [Schizopora paradoxa]